MDMSMHWGDFVTEQTASYGELVLGVDPVLEDIPLFFKKADRSATEVLEKYVLFLLDVAADQVGFVKFQSAFFEAFGSKGIDVLAQGIALAKKRNMGVILDAKRGDIGTTAAAYARAYLTPAKAGSVSNLEVDCLVVNPFLGPDTLEPFIDCVRKYGKGLFVLVKTSNPGSGWLQDKIVDGTRVSDRIAKLVADWAAETQGKTGLGSVGAVIGATFPEDGGRLRSLMPDSVILAPGIGPQGGKAEDIRFLRRQNSSGVLVSVSRGITKVDDLNLLEEDYAMLVRKRIESFKKSLNTLDR